MKNILIVFVAAVLLPGIALAQPGKKTDLRQYAAKVNLETEKVLLMQINHFTHIDIQLNPNAVEIGLDADRVRDFARETFLHYFGPEHFGAMDYHSQVAQAPLQYGYLMVKIIVVGDTEPLAWVCRMRLNNYKDFPWQYGMIVLETEIVGLSGRDQLIPDIRQSMDTMFSDVALQYFKARNASRQIPQ